MPCCKILIIDDDLDDVEILADAFLQCGFDDVHYVHSAMQAFSYLETVPPEQELPKLIVTDMFLPGITGNEFLKDLKGMKPYKHIPVVVLSSTKSEYDIKLARELGAEDYVMKPSSYAEYKNVAAAIASKILQSS